tara:strand:- start:613 stop:936 length:324 start_codon:yes stop_codon:yes gene_type:complete
MNDLTFAQWFAEASEALGLHHDINHPSNRDYDYIAAFYAGVPIPNPGEELPSKYKGELHDNRFVPFDEQGGEFYDSKTERNVGVQEVIVQDIQKENDMDNFLDTHAE